MATPRRGDVHMLRVGRLLAAEGYAVRSGVQVARGTGQGMGVDVDLVAVAYGPRLERQVTVVTCVGQGRVADRVLWTAGARQLLGVQYAAVASARRVDQATRLLATRLDVELIAPEDLDRRAVDAGSTNPQWASFDSGLWQAAQRAQRGAARHPGLAAIGNWATSDGWLNEPAATVKRSVGALRRLQEIFSPTLSDDESLTVRWLAHQAIEFLAFALVDLAARRLRTGPSAFEKRLLDDLSEGLASVQTLRALSRHVDAYLMGALTQSGMPPAQATERLGVLEPEPPPYADQLLEVVERFVVRPQAVRHFPASITRRVAEAQVAPAVLPAYQPAGAQGSPAIDYDSGPLLRLVAAFLRGQLGLDAALMEPLGHYSRQEPLPGTGFQSSDQSLAVHREEDPSIEALEAGVANRRLVETERGDQGTQTQFDTRPEGAADRGGSLSGTLALDETGHDLRPDGRGETGRLTIGVRNLGDAVRRVVHATATFGDGEPVEARGSVILAAGAREEVSFDVDAAAIQPDGDRITVKIVDDDGHEHHLALRYTDTGVVRSDR